MSIVLQSLIYLIFLLNSIEETVESSSPFLVEPGPENVLAPINTTVVLNCTAMSTAIGAELVWLVYVINRTNSLNSGRNMFDLSRLGLEAEETSELFEGVISSLLRINTSEVNNRTEVACQLNPKNAPVIDGNRIAIIVFDIPAQPSNVAVTDITKHTVNVSWSSETIPGVDVGFNLTVVNLNTSKEVTFELNNTYLMFTSSSIINSESCDVYRFQVTAINEAGRSEPSEAVETMLPSLPDISPVSESLNHTVEKKDDNISVTITSMFAGSCREYRVTNYRVVLSGLLQEIMAFPIIATGEKLEVTLGPSDGLMENTEYTYHITAENSVDTVISSSENFFTSDLRGLGIEKGENDSLTIQCLFINGSDALGCLILLVSSDDQIENISSTFYRSNSELILCGELNVTEDLSYYDEALGFDVEADNSTSDLGLPGELITTTNTGICSPKNVPDDDDESTITVSVPPEGTALVGAVIGGVLGVIALVVVITVVGFIIILFYPRDCEFKNSTNQAYGVTIPVQHKMQSTKLDDTEEHFYEEVNDVKLQ